MFFRTLFNFIGCRSCAFAVRTVSALAENPFFSFALPVQVPFDNTIYNGPVNSNSTLATLFPLTRLMFNESQGI